jgi:hypothetical protein
VALFRELDVTQQARIEAELVRRESVVRELIVDLAGRANIFLFVGLVLGAAAASAFVANRQPASTLMLISAVCFLAGLFVQGITFCVGNIVLWRLSFRFGGYKAAVLASQTDTSGLNIAAVPTKRDKVMFWVSFVPFLFWVSGSGLGISALAIDSQQQHVIGQATRTVSVPITVGATASEASAGPREPQVKSPVEVRARTDDHLSSWSVSDKIAFWAVVAAIVQAIALLMTFRLTALATRRQLRAYVFPETFDLYDGATINPPQPAHAGEPMAVLVLKNSGQTPAYKVVSLAQFQIIEPIHENQLVIAPLIDKFSANLGPGTSIRNSPRLNRHLSPQEITDINSGAKGLYLYGRIDYRDAFKKKRFTTFRMRYLGQYPPTGPGILNFTEGGNQID